MLGFQLVHLGLGLVWPGLVWSGLVWSAPGLVWSGLVWSWSSSVDVSVFQRKPKVPPSPVGCISVPKESPAGLGNLLSTGEDRPAGGHPVPTLTPSSSPRSPCPHGNPLPMVTPILILMVTLSPR